jgi:hypothetical protein
MRYLASILLIFAIFLPISWGEKFDDLTPYEKAIYYQFLIKDPKFYDSKRTDPNQLAKGDRNPFGWADSLTDESFERLQKVFPKLAGAGRAGFPSLGMPYQALDHARDLLTRVLQSGFALPLLCAGSF